MLVITRVRLKTWRVQMKRTAPISTESQDASWRTQIPTWRLALSGSLENRPQIWLSTFPPFAKELSNCSSKCFQMTLHNSRWTSKMISANWQHSNGSLERETTKSVTTTQWQSSNWKAVSHSSYRERINHYPRRISVNFKRRMETRRGIFANETIGERGRSDQKPYNQTSE